MYLLNKVVWFFVNPVVLPLMGIIFGAIFLARKPVGYRRRAGGLILGLSVAVLWFESTLTCVCLLGLPLERPYLATQAVESLPLADAIVVLGGGIGKCEKMAYPDMFEGADRLWHAARLWKAGKAPRVVVSGSNDLQAAVPQAPSCPYRITENHESGGAGMISTAEDYIRFADMKLMGAPPVTSRASFLNG